MKDLSKCNHEFEFDGDKGKYQRFQCIKCSCKVLRLNPQYKHYYKVHPDGCAWFGYANVEHALAEVAELIKCDDDDEQVVIIEKVLMTQKEIDELPEF